MKRKKFIIGSLLFLLLAVIIPATLWMVSARSATTSLNVTVQEAKVLVSEGAYLLDVRTQDEWDGAHVPGAVLIPLGELEMHENSGGRFEGLWIAFIAVEVSPFFFFLDLEVNLFPVDSDISRGSDTQTYLVTLHLDNHDFNIIVDYD